MATKKAAPDEGYTPSEAQLDLEQRQGSGNTSSLVLPQAVDPSESPFSGNGFVNVDPVYQNYANEADKPLAAQGGSGQVAEEQFDPTVPVASADSDKK